MELSLFRPPGTLEARYWRGSIHFGPQVPLGLVGLGLVCPLDILWAGGSQSLQARRPAIGTGGTQSFLAPRYPGYSWDSVVSAPQVPYGLSLSKRTVTGESLTASLGLVLVR